MRQNDPTITMPVSLLVDLFNTIPKDNPVREHVIDYLRTYKITVDEKGHVAEGFRLLTDGTLTFESSLYDEAVYRGKIETRSRGVAERLEKLKDELIMLRSMGESHQKALDEVSSESLEQRIGEGRPISNYELSLLNKIMPTLLALSEPDKEENEPKSPAT